VSPSKAPALMILDVYGAEGERSFPVPPRERTFVYGTVIPGSSSKCQPSFSIICPRNADTDALSPWVLA
jgi:hypothetical protein